MLSPLRAASSLSRRGAQCVGYRHTLVYSRAVVNQSIGKSFSSCAPSPRHPASVRQDARLQTYHVRFSSTEATKPQPDRKIPSLKAILRKFYLLTHPDKFSQFPEAKAANEASLRDFMSYIDDYKKHPRGFPGGRIRKIPVTFYIREQRDGEETNELRKVTGELLSNVTNPHAAKRRITQLFAACGLDGDFTFENDIWMPPDTENIHDFLGAALGHARDSLKQAAIHNTFVNATLSGLERKHGVKFDMGTGSNTYWAPSENREVAQKLVKLFTMLDADKWMDKGFMRSVEIGMDSEIEQSSQDTEGKVYLSRKETPEEWETFLRQVNWNEVHERRHKNSVAQNELARAKIASETSRKQKEEELAKIIGLRKINIELYNSFETQFSGEYKKSPRPVKDDFVDEEVEDFEKEAHAFLDKMIADKAILQNKNAKFTKKLRNTHVTFTPNMPKDIYFHLDRVGELRITTRLTARELNELLTEKLALMLELQRNEQKQESIRDFIEVRLGLKMLTQDYNYYYSQEPSVQQYYQALEKLQKLVDKLSALNLSGMTIAISDHYGLNLDGSLFIKWDFKDEDVILLLEGMKSHNEKSVPHKQIG